MNTTTHDYARALDVERYRLAGERRRLAEARNPSPTRGRGAVLMARAAMRAPAPASGRDPCT